MLHIPNHFFLFSAIPAKPEGPLVVTDVQRTSISIKWKPSPDDGGSPITGYIVEKRAASSSFWNKVSKVNASTFELCCPYLKEKTEYYFHVIAENRVGESAPLETKDATLAKSPFGKYIPLKSSEF